MFKNNTSRLVLVLVALVTVLILAGSACRWTSNDSKSTVKIVTATPEKSGYCGSDCSTVQPTIQPTATSIDGEVCYLWFGRWFDKLNSGHEGMAKVYKSALEAGMPLQEIWSQVVTAQTKLVAGLESVDPNFEVLNDGLQAVSCGDVAWAMPREIPSTDEGKKTEVWFGSISWVQLTPDGILVYTDDLGGTGSWEGLPAGKSMLITVKTNVSYLLTLKDFAHYRAAHDLAKTSCQKPELPNKAVVCEIFDKPKQQ